MNHSPDTVTNSTAPPPARRGLSLLLSLVAGLITWGFVHTQQPFFEVGEEYHIRGIGESDERWAAYLEQQSRMDYQNAALVVGLLGGTLAMALAFSRPQRLSLLGKILPGIALGVLVGAVAGLAGSSVQQSYYGTGQVTIVESLFIYATMYGILGFGLGGILASFNGWNRIVVDRAIVGLILGLAAATIYALLASFLFTSLDLDAFIPQTTLARLLWLGIVSGVLGFFLPSPKLYQTVDKPAVVNA